MLFSANIGFLYSDLPFLNRIEAAARDDFDGVECHWPYDIPAEHVRTTLERFDKTMLGLNTSPGNLASGEFGLAALPERAAEARDAIRQGVDYGAIIGARNLHVMAGNSDQGPEAENTFRENLLFACDLAAQSEMTVLIEPLNAKDHPDYHLQTVDHAVSIVGDLDRSNLKLMFDCYHVGRTQPDEFSCLKTLIHFIGHIQVAAVPHRDEPDRGDTDLLSVLKAFRSVGYDGWIGVEYRPRSGRVVDGIEWLPNFRQALRAQV